MRNLRDSAASEDKVTIEMLKIIWFLENYILNREKQWHYKWSRNICECYTKEGEMCMSQEERMLDAIDEVLKLPMLL